MDIEIEAEIDLDELMGQIVRSVDPSRVIDSMLDHLLVRNKDRDEALCRNLIRRINICLKKEHPSLKILIHNFSLEWPLEGEEEEEEEEEEE